MELPVERGCLGILLDLLFGPTVMMLLLVIVVLL